MSTCPTCGKTCKNDLGVKIHHARAHDESLVEDIEETCDECGEAFVVSPGSNGMYCSLDCTYRGQRDRVELDCEECGTTFEAEAAVAEDRQYCSRECYWESMARTERVECGGCGRTVFVAECHGVEHCSRACMAEARTNAPRPADLDGLLWLLYVYEENNARETWLRANAARPDDSEWLTRRAAKERLRENGWMRQGARARLADVTLEDVGLEPMGDDGGGDDSWRKFYGRGESA